MSDTLGSWLDQLQPASWRGLPFAVRGSEYRRGRRYAVHEYPFRDVPWPEDTGRAARITAFSGFVVGDDCYHQAKALVDASETKGLGTLVHPSLGRMTGVMVEPPVFAERTELGRVVELRFEFLEGGEPIFPGDATSTQDDVADKAAATETASASDFHARVGSPTSDATAAAAPAGTLSAPSTTYTDGKGSVTLVPATQGVSTYDNTQGGSTVRLWGDTATQQGADAGIAASPPAVDPPAGTTFGRFDQNASSQSGTGGMDTGATGTESSSANATAAQRSLDGQVQQRNEIDNAADAAARAAAIS